MAKNKDEDTQAPEPPPPLPKSGRGLRGADLKRLREKKNISLAEISDRTKITKPILAALEEERYADLPNARIYVRGFVRCLATELGVDPDEVEAAYLPGWDAWDAA